MSRHVVLDLNDKLGIIAVLLGIKEVFAGFDDEFLQSYTKAAHFLWLRSAITNRPPDRRHSKRKPILPQAFSQAMIRVDPEFGKQRRLVWIFKSSLLSTKIQKTRDGLEELGRTLGYPICCVEAYEEDNARNTELVYEYIVTELKARDDEEAIRILQGDPEIPFPLLNQALNRVSESAKKFPFISHVACDGCLSDEKSVSSTLNQRFRDIAVAANIEEKILASVKDDWRSERKR